MSAAEQGLRGHDEGKLRHGLALIRGQTRQRIEDRETLDAAAVGVSKALGEERRDG